MKACYKYLICILLCIHHMYHWYFQLFLQLVFINIIMIVLFGLTVHYGGSHKDTEVVK